MKFSLISAYLNVRDDVVVRMTCAALNSSHVNSEGCVFKSRRGQQSCCDSGKDQAI